MFDRPCSTSLKAIIFLTSFEADPDAYCNTSLYTTNVTRAGFTLHFDTSADTTLRRAGASWLAHSADRQNMYSGTGRTTDVCPHAHLQRDMETVGRAAFGDV